jgi:hypothetical protein
MLARGILFNDFEEVYLNSFDVSTYEKIGVAAAYQLVWHNFGEEWLLRLLSSHGNTVEDPPTSRGLLYYALSQTLIGLRSETQFPLPPETPPEIAKIAADAFHRTLRDLEKGFKAAAAKRSPELVKFK